jgi:hypothetical protein
MRIARSIKAPAPAFPLVAKEVYRRDNSERMDENRTSDCACANQQRKKNRELMILRHLFHHHILAHHEFTMRWVGTNNVRTAITLDGSTPTVLASNCDR